MTRRLPDDPSGISEPHDVLAAEEFAMPLRSRGQVPSDPIHAPHAVLAAEEFPMPTGGGTAATGGGFDPRSLLPALALAGVLAIVVRRLRR
ncbi:hypothetical protein BH20ACT19_BH20ACT19_06130 [soil metagenome]